jgi:putative ABC transport system ATP-binding protein
VRDLGKSVTGPEGTHILDGIGLTVGEGDSIAIVGASGSGKTTLLGLLAGSTCPVPAASPWPETISAMDEEARAAAHAMSASCSRASTCCRH